MKTKMYCVVIAFICAYWCGFASEQEPFVHPLLEATVARLDTVSSVGGMKEVRKDFERLYIAEPDQWLYAYYLAYTDISLFFLSTEAIDRERYQAEAENCLDELARMKLPDDAARSEVSTLKGYGYYARVAVDPATNGPKYAGVITSCFAEAMRLNPANPRALLLNTRFQKNMAVFLHQNYDAYEADIQRATRLFEKESHGGVRPHWGRGK